MSVVVPAPGGAPLARVLVTGAAGFVGRALCRALAAHGSEVLAVTRTPAMIEGAHAVLALGDLTRYADWHALLAGVDGVVHLAALTHDDTQGAAGARFHAVNVKLTERLGAAACAQDVRGFVYVSSIKVNGERSAPRGAGWQVLSAADAPAPEDDYGRSKLAAERALAAVWQAARGTLTVLRPPLVYGAGQKGNLARLCAHVSRGLPLPCVTPANRRSLLQVDNLADAIVLALACATPGQRCYTLADIELSSADLARAIARALGVEARLWPLPARLLGACYPLPWLGAVLRRLADSLVVDAEAIRVELGWRPRVGFEQAIAAACAAWRAGAR